MNVPAPSEAILEAATPPSIWHSTSSRSSALDSIVSREPIARVVRASRSCRRARRRGVCAAVAHSAGAYAASGSLALSHRCTARPRRTYADRRAGDRYESLSRGHSTHPHSGTTSTPPPRNRNASAGSWRLFSRGRRNCFCFEVTTSVTVNLLHRSIFIPAFWGTLLARAQKNPSERGVRTPSWPTIKKSPATFRPINSVVLPPTARSGVDGRLAFLTPHETWNSDVHFAQLHLARTTRSAVGPKLVANDLDGPRFSSFGVVDLSRSALTRPRRAQRASVRSGVSTAGSRSWQSISPDAPAEAKLIAVGDRVLAPDFAHEPTTNGEVGPPLSDRKGKAVLVNFWATRCGGVPGRNPVVPGFVQQSTRRRARTRLGVSLDCDGWTSVRPYLKEKPIHLALIVIGDETTAQEFHVTAMPVTVLIDRQGKIAADAQRRRRQGDVSSRNRLPARIGRLCYPGTAPYGFHAAQRPADRVPPSCFNVPDATAANRIDRPASTSTVLRPLIDRRGTRGAPSLARTFWRTFARRDPRRRVAVWPK